MLQRFFRIIRAMELEERVFHVGSFVCLIGLFFPWLSSGSYGEEQSWANGFGFRTGYIGQMVFLVTLFLAFMMLSPVLGGPVIVRKSHRHVVRFFSSISVLLLLLSAFTILLRITFEVSGAEIRFGIYVSLVGSALSCLYSFLTYQEMKNHEVNDLFHHPDEPKPARFKNIASDQEFVTIPPPPPPSPPPLEDHHLFTKSS